MLEQQCVGRKEVGSSSEMLLIQQAVERTLLGSCCSDTSPAAFAAGMKPARGPTKCGVFLGGKETPAHGKCQQETAHLCQVL